MPLRGILIINNNLYEKKMNAAQLNGAAQVLKDECMQLEKELNEVMKRCNSLNRLLEYAIWEEDMVVGETITFHCSLEEFVAQIAPLIESRKWTVNDCHEVKPFLRSLDTVMKVCPEGKEELLALGTLVNGVMEYLSTRKDD